MNDCTTCKHCEACDDFFSCEIKTYLRVKADMYVGNSCDDYEERDDGLVLTQLWDWR